MMRTSPAIAAMAMVLAAPLAGLGAFEAEDVARLRTTGNCSECKLAGAELAGIALERVNPDQANLKGAFLYKADLSGANLAGAKLPEAILLGADLFKANLSRADLRGADLRDANLIAADLRGADLSGATLYQYQIDLACGDTDTRLPEGRRIPTC